MDLNEIAAFKAVAEAGSFSIASKASGLPKSTLSRKVAQLEKRLGVTLLTRNTRQVKVTEIGLEYLKICQRALSELEDAEKFASRSNSTPRGRLRISAPFDLGTNYLAKVASDFAHHYPEVELDFNLTDEIVDLLEEKIDLAVRAGPLSDSSLKAQRLGQTEFQLFASPGYLKKHGTPRTPRDLERHRCIFFKFMHPDGIWHLNSTSGRVSARSATRILTDSLNMAKHLAMDGCGIALLPVFLGDTGVQTRQLERVLKNWGTDREPVHAVFPDQPYVPQKTRLFLEFLKKAFS
jgi:DNA-binding transcriptional LysR family regulator